MATLKKYRDLFWHKSVAIGIQKKKETKKWSQNFEAEIFLTKMYQGGGCGNFGTLLQVKIKPIQFFLNWIPA